MRKKAKSMIAAMAMLNCCIKRAVSSSWAQNQKMNTCWLRDIEERRTAHHRNSVSTKHHSTSPSHSGTTANGAKTIEKNGP